MILRNPNKSVVRLRFPQKGIDVELHHMDEIEVDLPTRQFLAKYIKAFKLQLVASSTPTLEEEETNAAVSFSGTTTKVITTEDAIRQKYHKENEEDDIFTDADVANLFITDETSQSQELSRQKDLVPSRETHHEIDLDTTSSFLQPEDGYDLPDGDVPDTEDTPEYLELVQGLPGDHPSTSARTPQSPSTVSPISRGETLSGNILDAWIDAQSESSDSVIPGQRYPLPSPATQMMDHLGMEEDENVLQKDPLDGIFDISGRLNNPSPSAFPHEVEDHLPPACPYTRTQLTLMVKAKLWTVAEDLGLDTSGTKADLVDRIINFYEG